ncbi:probable G-protein coupled receptor 179 [Dromaius novaehollandiae]|uniref:probable G-protein coupled receptor 179 n=1 Tax=Dromaius novaehollandiae TaxID=8790 RepID=UPI00312031BA
MLLQANDIREASLAEDAEWYHALVRGLAAGEPRAYRAVLAFDAHPLASKPRLVLQATQESPEILLQDLSAAAAGNLSGDDAWPDAPEPPPPPGFSLRKRLLRNDLRSLETPKWSRGDGYVGDAGHVRWSPPFLECRDGKFLPAWMVSLSSPFYGLKPDLSPELKGIVRLDVKLQDVQLDPCASGTGWFADTHRCDLNSTQCVPQESRGFVLGSYLCRCKPGFYGAAGQLGVSEAGGRLACRPCRPGCTACVDDAPCLIEEDRALRAAVLACQAACMLAVFLCMLVSYHFRRSKRIRASGVVLLETILFGSLLLYFPVFILYFKPSTFRCIVLRWVRVLGFAIVYGTITLKLHRVLQAFLCHSAQRGPYPSSGRVLKLLGLMLLLALWFLAAWTGGMLENADRSIPLVIGAQTARGLRFQLCGHDRWDYMMVVAEMLLLLWGSSLCFATRAVPSAFHEPRYLGVALHNELLVSAAFHVARFALVPSLHPDWTLLLFFAHAHGTVTMTLVLLFVPKFLHAGSPLRQEIAAEVYEDELDMRRSGSCLNSIASAWSERSLDPDDIREELKKLYAQLEAQRARRMAADNPHLPKRRGSRRGPASVLRRIAELPAAGGTSLRLWEGSRRRRRTASLRKVRSAEDGAPRPRGSPARKTAAAKAPEASDSESLEAAPLVCKSASAHELAADKQPPPPLQKSLSLVAGARDEALLLASRAARQDPPGAPPGRAAPTVSRGAGAPARVAAGSPCRAPARRRVAYAPIKSASADGAPRPGRVRVAVRRTPPAPPVRHQSLAPPPGPGELLREELAGRERAASMVLRAEAAAEAGVGPRGALVPPAAKGPLVRQEAVASREDGGVPPGRMSPIGRDEPARPRERAASREESGGVPGTGQAPPTPPSPAARETWPPKPAGLTRRETVCPWESLEAERLAGTRGTPSPLAPGAGRAGSGEGKAADFCPWDAAEAAPEAERPDQGGRGLSKWVKIRPKSVGLLRAWESGSGRPAGRRPWGSASAEATAAKAAPKSPELPKVAPRSPRSTKAALCPWGTESGGAETRPWEASAASSDAAGSKGDGRETRGAEGEAGAGDAAEHPGTGSKAEICPGEASEVRPGKEGRKGREKGKDPADKRITRQAALASPATSLEKGSSEREAVCPWESPDPGEPAAKPRARGWGLLRSPSRASQSAESPKAEVCPWETQERKGSGRAEICPWESPDPGEPAAKPRARGWGLLKSPSRASQSAESPKAEVCLGETQERKGSGTAEICPWESPDPGEPAAKPRARGWGLLKSPSRASQSAESPKAEVCLGETQERKGSGRAEICPWESPGAEETAAKPRARGWGLLKSPSRASQSAESPKAEVCPWETQEHEGGCRAEICPWEGAAPPLAPGKTKPVPRGASKGDKRITRQAALASPERSPERGSSERETVCPWESLDPGETAAKPRARGWGLLKSPSRASQSAESPKADVCPWETQEREGGGRAEICPWEAAAPPSPREKLRPAKDGLSPGSKSPSPIRSVFRETGGSRSKEEKGSRARESAGPRERTGTEGSSAGDGAERAEWLEATSGKSESAGSIKAEVCPWESPDTEELAAKPHAGSQGLPKAPSRKAEGTESRRADICPWETAGADAGVRSDACPWEGLGVPPEGPGQAAPSRAGAAGSGHAAATSAPAAFGSSQRESVCPWESPGVGEPSQKNGAGKSPCEKSEIAESRKADVCPWEAAEPEAAEKESVKPEAQPRGAVRAAEHKPLCRVLPGIQPPRGPGRGSGPGAAEVCPWEAEGAPPAPQQPGPDPSEPSAVCPWEAESAEPIPARRGQGTAGESPGDGGSGATRSNPDVCPWEQE